MAILILNGSPSGSRGNCAVFTKVILGLIRKNKNLKDSSVDVLHLSEFSKRSQVIRNSQLTYPKELKSKLISKIKQADGLIIVTGTYWDSWGSPLQIFLENLTDFEGHEFIVGKPAIVCVLNHSVGGKAVLSRLQGVLSTFGFLIPPMSGLVFSWVNQELIQKNPKKGTLKDLWSLDDLPLILENLSQAIQLQIKWQNWPVDRKDYKKVWLKT